MKVLCNVSVDPLNVYTSLACMFCFPKRGPKGTLPFVFHTLCEDMHVSKTKSERNGSLEYHQIPCLQRSLRRRGKNEREKGESLSPFSLSFLPRRERPLLAGKSSNDLYWENKTYKLKRSITFACTCDCILTQHISNTLYLHTVQNTFCKVFHIVRAIYPHQ